MAFTVINSVRTSKEDLPAIVKDVQRLGLHVLRQQPGFRAARLLVAEDQQEIMLIIEWTSRDHFVAYRQSDVGHALVERGAQLHPHIAFYRVIESHDPLD